MERLAVRSAPKRFLSELCMKMKEMNLTESEIQGYEMVVEVLAKALDIIDRQYRIKYKQFRIKGEPVDNEDQIYQLYWNQTIATEKGLQSYLERFRKRNAKDAADNAAIDFCTEVIGRMIRSVKDALTEDRFWKHYTYVDGQLVKRGSFEEKKIAESKLEE